MKKTLSHYSSFIVLSHIVFALPFALVGYMMAIEEGGSFRLTTLALIILCMFWARNAAMSFNRIVDAKFDAINPRTQKREIPSKIISIKNAYLFCLANVLLFIASSYFINSLCFALSFVALAVILGYSYMKRITSLCHFILGVGLSLAPIGSYIATTNHFALLPLLLSFMVLFWVAGFDILYSLQDEEFDKKNKLHSIPSLLGYAKSVYLARVCHIISFLLLFSISFFLPYFSFFYLAGCAIFIIMLAMQHLKIRQRNISRINRQFLLFNGWASIMFCIFFCFHHLCQPYE